MRTELVKVYSLVASENAAQRLTRRVAQLLERERYKPARFRKTQRLLAKAIGIEPATLSQTLSGRHNSAFRMIHLDSIADFFGVTPSTLIQYEHSSLVELTPNETRLVKHWRNWPEDIQQQVMGAADYFAGLLPEEKEERRWWQMIRRLDLDEARDLEGILRGMLQAKLDALRRARDSETAPAGRKAAKPPSPPARLPSRREPGSTG